MSIPFEDAICPETQGHVGTYCPGTTEAASARLAMSYNQYPQAIYIEGSNPNPIFTGAESEIAQFTFGKKAPCTMEVISVVERFKRKQGETHKTPLLVVTYRNLDKDGDHVDAIEIPRILRTHYKFCHEMQFSDKLWATNIIPKNSLLSWSKNVTFDQNPKGVHGPGISLNLIYKSSHSGTEDGIKISQSTADKCKSMMADKFSVSYGKKLIPMNINGTRDNYKAFLDIGERVREDGLLMAFRQVDEFNAGFFLLDDVLMELDICHDLPYFVKPGAEIYDISCASILNESTDVPSLHVYEEKLDKNGKCTIPGVRKPHLPVDMLRQPLQIAERQSEFFGNVYHDYRREEQRGQVTFGPKLTSICSDARGDRPNATHKGRRLKETIKRTWRAAPLDDIRLEISIVYDFEQSLKTKISNLVGGKGVVCQIVPDSHMPVNEEGTRADIELLDRGNVARLIPWAIKEPTINAIAKGIQDDIRKMAVADRKAAYMHLLKMYSIISPPQYDEMLKSDLDGKGDLTALGNESLDYALACKRLPIYIPPSNDWLTTDFYKKIKDFRPPHKSCVTFINDAGRKCVSKEKFLIGEMYFLILDKSESEAAACSGALNNHYGLPSKKNRLAKYATQTKESPLRHNGESEGRAKLAFGKPEAHKNLLELTTHPQKRHDKFVTIFNAKKPTRIKQLVNPANYGYGDTVPNKIIGSMLGILGVRITFKTLPATKKRKINGISKTT